MVEYRQRLRVMLSATQSKYDLQKSSIAKNIKYIYYFTYFHKFEVHPYYEEFETKIKEKVQVLRCYICCLWRSYCRLNKSVSSVLPEINCLLDSIHRIDNTMKDSIDKLKQLITKGVEENKEGITKSIGNIDCNMCSIKSNLESYIRCELKEIIKHLEEKTKDLQKKIQLTKYTVSLYIRQIVTMEAIFRRAMHSFQGIIFGKDSHSGTSYTIYGIAYEDIRVHYYRESFRVAAGIDAKLESIEKIEQELQQVGLPSADNSTSNNLAQTIEAIHKYIANLTEALKNIVAWKEIITKTVETTTFKELETYEKEEEKEYLKTYTYTGKESEKYGLWYKYTRSIKDTLVRYQAYLKQTRVFALTSIVKLKEAIDEHVQYLHCNLKTKLTRLAYIRLLYRQLNSCLSKLSSVNLSMRCLRLESEEQNESEIKRVLLEYFMFVQIMKYYARTLLCILCSCKSKTKCDCCCCKQYLEDAICELRQIKCQLHDLILYVYNIGIFAAFKLKLLELERCLDYRILGFLRCSLESSICNIKRELCTVSRDCPDNECNSCLRQSLLGERVSNLEEQLYRYSRLVLGHSSTLETRLLVSRLYECMVDADNLLKILKHVYYCECLRNFKVDEKRYAIKIPYKFVGGNLFIKSNFYKKHPIDRLNNHKCLCLVVKYCLYPRFTICISSLVELELGISSQISRKFHNYKHTYSYVTEVSQLIILAINILLRVFECMKKRYFSKGTQIRKRCFCFNTKDTLYRWFISVILWLSWLLDNLFSLRYSDVHHCIQLLSNLYSELEEMCCDPHKKATPKPKPQKGIFDSLLSAIYGGIKDGIEFGINTFSRLFFRKPLIDTKPKISSVIKNTCCTSNTPCNLCVNYQALYRVIVMARQTFYWVSPKGFSLNIFGVVYPNGGGNPQVLMYFMAYYGPIINKITVTYYRILDRLKRLSLNECQSLYFLQFLSDLSFYVVELDWLNFGTKAYIANVINNYSAGYIYAIKKTVKPDEKRENECLEKNCGICKKHKVTIDLLSGLQKVLNSFIEGTKTGSRGPKIDPPTKDLEVRCGCDNCCMICLQSGDIILFITDLVVAIDSYSKETKPTYSGVPKNTLVSLTETWSVTEVMAVQTNTKCQCTLVLAYFKYLLKVLQTRQVSVPRPEPEGKATIKVQKTIAGSRSASVSTAPPTQATTTTVTTSVTTSATETTSVTVSGTPSTTTKEPAPTKTVTTSIMTEIKGDPVIFVGLKNIMDSFFDKEYFKCGCESVTQCCCCCPCEECGTGKSRKCNKKEEGNGNHNGHQGNGGSGSPPSGGGQGTQTGATPSQPNSGGNTGSGHGQPSGQQAGEGTGTTNGQGDNKCPCQKEECCCINKDGKRKCCNCTKGKPETAKPECNCCCFSCCADKENEDKKPHSQPPKPEGQQEEGDQQTNVNKCPCKKKKKEKPKTHCKDDDNLKDKRCCCKCRPEKKGEGGNGATNGGATSPAPPPATNNTSGATNSSPTTNEKDCCCCCKCKTKCGKQTAAAGGGGGNGGGCNCHKNGKKDCNCYCCFDCVHEKSALKSVCKQLAYELKSSISVLSKLASNMSIECVETDQDNVKKTLTTYLEKCNRKYPETCVTATRTGRGCDRCGNPNNQRPHTLSHSVQAFQT